MYIYSRDDHFRFVRSLSSREPRLTNDQVTLLCDTFREAFSKRIETIVQIYRAMDNCL